MDVKEKLVELLRNAKAAMKSENLSCDIARNMFVVDFMMANGVTVQEWISVKDGLPENDYGKHWKERKHYLVRLEPSGLMCVAHYGYKEYDWWIDGRDCVLSATNFKEVTHWMLLPELPKGE